MNLPRIHIPRTAAAALLVLGLVPATGLAQKAPAPADEQVIKLEAFSVTGSNIKRLEMEKVLPVTVFDNATIDVRDASEAADLLTALPEVTGLPGNETAFSGAASRGDNATVSMRGLPSANTLILLDGRRVAPHPITQSEAGTPTLSVNVNQCPTGALTTSMCCATGRPPSMAPMRWRA